MKKIFLPLILLLSVQSTVRADIKVWARSYLEPMSGKIEAPENPSGKIKLHVTPGEYEPASFAVRADRNVSFDVRLHGGDLPLEWCELYTVESLADSTKPNRLYPLSGSVCADSAETRFFWLTIRCPEQVKPGLYSCRLDVVSGSSNSELIVECEVYPFMLETNRITAGVFMCLADLPDDWYSDMKQHGIDAIQFFTWEWSVRDTTMLARRGEWSEEPIKLTRRGDRMVLDFSAMDRIMGRINEAGMAGPVVVSLGNDRFMHYETRIADVMGLPVDTTVAPTPKGWSSPTISFIGPPMSERLDSLFIDGLRQLHKHWAQKKWPQELVLLIYDEPTHGLLERGLQRYQMIKARFPRTRIYGVVMDKRELAEEVAPQCDIIVANGDFDEVREVAGRQSKDFYVYGSMGPVNYSRFRMGCMPWRTGASGAFFWMYNYWFYSPDGCAVYQGSNDWKRLVPSVNWECIREGADDLRYFATAEQKIAQLPPERRKEAAARLEHLRNSIDPDYRSRPGRSAEMSEDELLEHYLVPQRAREEVVKIILSLQ
jgi:hypothetical protein